MTFIIILAAGIFLFYLFNNDKKDVKNNAIQRGGLKSVYPNFVRYIETENSGKYLEELTLISVEIKNLTLTKDDGEYLEYRFPISDNNGIRGYYHIGIHHTFGTFAYCFAINAMNKKINGLMSELHNGRTTSAPRDRNIDNYRSIFTSLITSMEEIKNFEEKFYFNDFN